MKNEKKFFDAQKVVSSGKKLTLPSENPTMMGRVLDYKKTLSMIGQHQQNISFGKSRSEIIEPTLDSVNELLHEAKNLAMNLSSGNIDEETRNTSIQMVESIYNQLMGYANTKDGANYIFSGHQSKTAPYSTDADFNATWQGDEGDVRLIIGPGRDISLNNGGQKVFEADGVEFFDMLRDLRTGIENGDSAMISNQVDLLDSAIEHVRNVRIDGSIKYDQMKVADSNLTKLKMNVETLKAAATDADMNEAVIELKTQETAYQASLASAAKIIQTSLLDFLR
jgi:flagellar hook-associated protein 3 FlgL